MKLFMRKQGAALVPIDDDGTALLARVKDGRIIAVEAKQKRNIDHHRLYWALITKVHGNLDDQRRRLYPTPELLHEAIKVSVGLRTQFEMPNGQIGLIAGSIAWSKMDQFAFGEFYDRVCDAVAKYFLPGVDKAELKAEVESMIGMRAA